MIYKAGDAIPPEWFSTVENVKTMAFGRDVSVEIEDGKRTVRPIGPGEHTAIFHPIEGGGLMSLVASPPLVFLAGDGTAYRKEIAPR